MDERRDVESMRLVPARGCDRRLVAVLAVCAAAVAAHYLGPGGLLASDARYYMQMAQEPGAAVPLPWAWRVLIPSVVRSLPIHPEEGFLWVNCAAVAMTLVGMYVLLRHMRIRHGTAVVTLVLLCLSYPIAFNLSVWGLVDGSAYACIVWVIVCVLKRRYWLGICIVGAGCAVKESCVLLVPLILVSVWQRKPSSRIPLIVASILVPVGTLAAVLSLVEPATGPYQSASIVETVSKAVDNAWSFNARGFGLIPRIPRELLKSYGFFWVFWIIGLLSSTRSRGLSIYLVSAGVAQCCIATDWSRMLGWGFVGIFVPVACFLDMVRDAVPVRRGLVLLLALAVAQCRLFFIAYNPLSLSGKYLWIGANILVFTVGAGASLYLYFRANGIRRRAAHIC